MVLSMCRFSASRAVVISCMLSSADTSASATADACHSKRDHFESTTHERGRVREVIQCGKEGAPQYPSLELQLHLLFNAAAPKLLVSYAWC